MRDEGNAGHRLGRCLSAAVRRASGGSMTGWRLCGSRP